MFHDIGIYYYRNVLESFVRYRETSDNREYGDSQDLKNGIEAATAMFHFMEHLPDAIRPTRKELEKACPDFAIVGDVANVSKHHTLDRPTPHGAPLVTSVDQLSEVAVHTEYCDTEGTYLYCEKIVRIRLSDGTERILLDVLTNVINHWEQFLFNAGINDKARVFTSDRKPRFRTRQECGNGLLATLKITKGVGLRPIFEFYRFDPYRCVNASFFEPCSQINFGFDSDGRLFKAVVLLFGEDHAKLHVMTSEQERVVFVHSLPVVQDKLKELRLEAGVSESEPIPIQLGTPHRVGISAQSVTVVDKQYE